MAKNIFYVSAALSNKKKSILEVSTDFIDLFLTLGDVDPVFLSPEYVRNNTRVAIKIKEGKEIAVEDLAKVILESNLSDIRQHEKVENPTINFSRDFGFLLLFEFFKEGRYAFAITARVGSSDGQELKIDFLMDSPENDFDWYYSVIKGIVHSWSLTYIGLIIKSSTFLDPFRELKVWPALGWITYFSNDGALKIPDDLKGIEYEKTDKGSFLIITKEDITASREVFDTHRNKLLDVMKEIKGRVPEYTERI